MVQYKGYCKIFTLYLIFSIVINKKTHKKNQKNKIFVVFFEKIRKVPKQNVENGIKM